MDASSGQHNQEIMASQSLDSMLVCTNPQNQQQEKKPRPADQQALKCPRCDSTNTKFCYYNNYSLSQPRYFCKSCRRYWTKGGTLRNVPVGGGCRKNKRSSSSSRRSTPDNLPHPHPHHQGLNLTTSNPTSSISPFDHPSTHDLTLAFARLHKEVGGGPNMGFDPHHDISILGNPSNSNFDLFGNPNLNHHQMGNSFLDTLRGGLLEGNPQGHNGLNHFYYGIEGEVDLGNVENGGGNCVNLSREDHHLGIQFEVNNVSSGSSTPIIKQEILGENRALWGFPWQLNGTEVNNFMNVDGNEMDSIKESWSNGVLGSTWHGLVNSPLM